MTRRKKGLQANKNSSFGDHPHLGKENIYDAPEWVELARYQSVVGNSAERGLGLTSSLAFDGVTSRAEWRHLTQFIEPSRPLTDDDLVRLPNHELQLGALIYGRAIDAMLRIEGASDAIRSDVATIFRHFQPKGAEGRARAQEEALRPRGRSKYAVAKAAGYDPSQFNKDVAGGDIAFIDLER